MAVTVDISNTPMPIKESALTVHNALQPLGISTAALTVEDESGTEHFVYGQPVTVTDDQAGFLYNGYVYDSIESNLYPNAAIESAINSMDQHYLADKRVSQKDYVEQYAGDIAVDLCANYLAEEGVTAAYAQRTDATQTDFQVGTLSGVSPASNVGDGDLELSPAGTAVTKTEQTTSDFSAGTLTNMQAANNLLTLAPTQAMKLVGVASSGVRNPYVYYKIWAGSYTIVSGDTLQFDIWISSSSPQIKGGVDGICSDGQTLRDFKTTAGVQLTDQNGIWQHPGQDLSGFGNDQWYSRSIDLSLLPANSHNTLSTMMIAQEGDTAGTYTIWVRNVRITNGSTTKLTVFSSSLSTNVQVQNLGYSSASLTTIATYQKMGTRISPATSIAAAGIVRNSVISWVVGTTAPVVTAPTTTPPVSIVAVTPTTPTTPTTTTAIEIDTSFDGGATWQIATNHLAIPSLSPGFKTGASSIMTRVIMLLTGTSPEVSPTLSSVQWTVAPSYACIKNDLSGSTSTTAGWNAGTLTNLLAANNMLTLNGKWRNWDNADISNQTVYSSDVNGNNKPIQGECAVTCSSTGTAGNFAISRFDFAGQWADFTMEIDLLVPDGSLNLNSGLVYRTTAWNSTNDTYAYNAYITSTDINLHRGSNSGTGGATSLGQVVLSDLTVGDWHRLKVVCAGSSHKIYLDDVLYISVTDATFTAAGYVGARFWNNDNASSTTHTHSGFYDNFGIVAALTGTRVRNVSPIGTVGTIGASLIQWSADVQSGDTLLVETSTDNSHWYACTNGGAIPNLGPGVVIAGGTNFYTRITITAANAAASALLGPDGNTYLTPTLHGLAFFLSSQFSASGSRVGPALNLASVGRAGYAQANWNAISPTNTGLFIDTSLDGKTWTNVGTGVTSDVAAGGNAAVAGITAYAPENAIEDTFDANTSSFYTNTSQTSGTPASWTWGSTNVTASGGTNAYLLYSNLSVADVDLITDMDTSDAGGLVWRFVDSNNFYDLVVADSASPTPNSATLYKVANGNRSTLSTASISWTRTAGIPKRIRVTMLGAVITAYLDGVQVLSYTDNFPLGAGICGLRTSTVSGASSANFYFLRIMPQGDDVSRTFVYTRVRLTSTDPTVTPQLLDLTTSVRSPNIATGAFIPNTTYSVLNGSTNSLAQDFDDLAKQSNYWWRIDKNKEYFFQPHNGVPAPFCVSGNDMLVGSRVTVKNAGDLFRTVPWVLGGTDTSLSVEPFATDGIKQTFTLQHPVDSLVKISDGTKTYTFGVQGVDTGKDFYYTLGSNTISQDATENPLPAGLTLMITSNAQVNVVATTQDASLIASQAAIENTSGKIEVAETASGLNRAAASQLAASRLSQYGVKPKTIQFTTRRIGLDVGMQLPVFFPWLGIIDGQYLIVDVVIQWRTLLDNAVPFFTITAVAGPIMNSWATTLAGLARN